jgi:uncharacterized protein YjiS (DUF1127 family)
MSQWSFHTPALPVHRTAQFSPRPRRIPFSITRSLAATLRLWIERSRQRRHLAELARWDDHLLKDIGVSRDATLREAAKPFWQQ